MMMIMMMAMLMEYRSQRHYVFMIRDDVTRNRRSPFFFSVSCDFVLFCLMIIFATIRELLKWLFYRQKRKFELLTYIPQNECVCGRNWGGFVVKVQQIHHFEARKPQNTLLSSNSDKSQLMETRNTKPNFTLTQTFFFNCTYPRTCLINDFLVSFFSFIFFFRLTTSLYTLALSL